MSLDLRGTVPTADELDRVEADPSEVATIRDEYLQDPRLEGRLINLFAERFHTRLDEFEVQYYDYDLEESQEFEFEQSVGEEPLRLMAHVAMTDAPWSDIVTADYTMSNEMLASLWPISYPEGASGWTEAQYTDGRPAAGILATNGLWWRYVTNTSNQNRSRAAAIARLLLCQDMLSRPVTFSGGATSLADSEATAEAIRTQPACIACHSAIEPLASSMFGFWVATSYNPLELANYHAEREQMGEDLLQTRPGYFGKEIEGLVDLGGAIAEDTRFWRCAARSAAEMLWRRDAEIGDFDTIEDLRTTFIEQGATYRPLLRAVTNTDAYRAGGFSSTATDADQTREMTYRMLTAEQLASAVEDLTGFRWTYENFDQLSNDDYGYRVLSGGVDGYAVGKAQSEPGITWALVVKRLAQAAGDNVVATELEADGDRRLFTEVTLDDRPGDDAFTAELKQLHWRMFGRRATDERLAADEALWTEVEAADGAAAAWATLVSALLRDPEFVGY
jgi:hypothetical protein